VRLDSPVTLLGLCWELGRPALSEQPRDKVFPQVRETWHGAAYRNRTDDLLITSETLYRLS
jgi:hypothetical protein